MPMNAEQLEELQRLAKLPNDSPTATILASLARRVLVAEKLVEALGDFQDCDCKRHNCAICAWFSDADAALTAYREASK